MKHLINIFVAFLILAISDVQAQEGLEQGNQPSIADAPLVDTIDWELLGPWGGYVNAIAVSPDSDGLVLAGTKPENGPRGGLYRSTDGGATWENVLANFNIYDIEFAAGGVAYAGTMDSVWKSTDFGETWLQIDLTIGINRGVKSVAVDPNQPDTVWIGIVANSQQK